MDIGIRREDKNRWERRTPLTPQHVEELVKERGIGVVVQPSPIRTFDDEEYRQAGAVVQDDLSACRVIFGVKEIPIEQVLPRKPYMCFSHVIKGQEAGMPLLRAFLDRQSTLIDYEPIVDRQGRRLLFFGRQAGQAGMIDGLWSLGQRLEIQGFETPFARIQPAHAYRNLDEALNVLSGEITQHIREHGVPHELQPLVIGVTGGGNVAQGAHDVLDRLPLVEIDPEELPDLAEREGLSRRVLYKVVFRRDQRKRFTRHLPYITLLVNGIYWEPGDRRLVTREDVETLWADGATPKLRAIADLSCDIQGSVEVTLRATSPEDPVYVYDPATGKAESGFHGHGPVILAVDNLPAEIPRDASAFFGDALFPFVSGILAADFSVAFEHLALPAAVLRGVIAHGGELALRYRDLEDAMRRAGV